MQTPSAFFRRDDGTGRHRASSDPLSRGGAFGDGNGLLSQEPNPFEQSFGPLAAGSSSSGQKPTDGTLTAGGRRARSTSPSSLMPRMTPGGTQRLPPLALMQSPGGNELSAFGWGDSLRTGPLSPALLNGPAAAGTSQSSGHHAAGLYDSSLKTGLTPFLAGGPSGPAAAAAAAAGAGAGAGAGQQGGQGGAENSQAAPGGTSAAGTNGGVSFPPPSPATAALFALMTNNTPGAADPAGMAGGGPRPHEGPNEANSFEASFARANSDNDTTAAANAAAGGAPVNQAGKLRNSLLGAGPNGSSAAHPPGMMSRASAPAIPGGSHAPLHAPISQQGGPAGGYYPGQQPQQQASYYAPQPPHHQHHPQPPHHPHHAHSHHSQQQQPHQHQHQPPPPHPPQPLPQHSSAGHLSFTAPPPPSNPLDLLSQASFHNDDAVVAAAALSGLATPGGGFPAAAMLAAAQQQQQHQQQQQQQHSTSGVMPDSTVQHQGGGGPNGNSATTSPVATSVASGRGKRAAASQQQIDPATGAPSVPAKRARKQTAAAQAAQEEMQYAAQHHEEEEAAPSTRSKAGGGAGAGGAGKRGKRGGGGANSRRDTADGWTDGTASAEGSMPPEFDSVKAEDGMYGDDGDGDGGDGGMQSGQSKGGRGRKKDSGETEEEKRKNFLERNRQAALKCRQRKKAWLQSLQTKVELLTTDNDALQNTVNHLREEISSLRAILSAHANCPIAMSNTGVPMQPQPQQHGGYGQHAQHGPPPGMQQQAGYARAGY